jgi:uncharacterized iron-regulated membrane protein
MLWDVHGIAGALSSLILFVAFFAGTLTIFHGAIAAWEQPSRRVPDSSPSSPASIDTVLAPFLAQDAPKSAQPPDDHVFIWLPGKHDPLLRVYRSRTVGDQPLDEANAVFDEAGRKLDGGEAGPAVADHLYTLHYRLALPDPFGLYAYWIFGLAAVVGLLVVVAGLLFHLRLLAIQFFQFRPRAGMRTLWTDAHKVLGVLGLPYWLMYLFTGAWFPLAGPLMLLLDATAFRNEGTADAITPPVLKAREKPAGVAAPTLGFDAIERRARAVWPGLEVEAIDLQHRGDANGYYSVYGKLGAGFFGQATLWLGATDGAELAREDPAHPTFAEASERTITRLHFADYGGLALRWCYFILGIGGCLCIVSGTLVWTELRRERSSRPSPLGTALWLAPATVGVCLGLCAATASMFLASKLIPPGTADRGWWEKLVFWSAWGLTALYGAARRPTSHAVRDLFALSAALCLAIPIANAVATGDHLLHSLSLGLWPIAGVDSVALACALTFATAARLISRDPFRKAQNIETAKTPPPPAQRDQSGR